MNIRKLLLSVMALVTALAAHCADFTIDLLGYDILDAEAHTVQLSSVGRTYPDTLLIIPETVEYDGVAYTVTSVNIALQSYIKITAITIPKTVTDIERLRGNGIIQISFDEGSQLKNIGNSAFSSCKFSEFRIPESVEYIGARAFLSCTMLTSIDIPEGIDTIRENTFLDCDCLSDIKLPKGLKVIEKFAFFKTGINTIKRASVTLPEQLDSIDSYAFSATDIYPTSTVPPALAYKAFGDGVTVIIEDIPSLDPYYNDIRWRPYIKGPSINVDGLIYRILSTDKARLTGITPQSSITVPEKLSYDKYTLAVTDIDSYIFDPGKTDAGKIKEIRIKAHLTDIGIQHFPSELTYIELPKELKRIEKSTFSGCRMLTSIDIPDSVEYIGTYAFSGCGIETFTPPEKIRKIEDFTFEGCSSLKTVTLNDSITEIGFRAFHGCAIEEIKLPVNIENIQMNAFAGTKVTELHIPHTIKRIAFDFYDTMEYLKNIFITGGTHEKYCDIDGVLFGKDGEGKPSYLLLYPCNRDAAEYTVPDGTMFIESYAFRRQEGYPYATTPLKKVNLPEGLKEIKNYAFANNYSLESINFPKSLIRIYEYAFGNDRKLTVRIPETDSQLNIGNTAFTVNTAYIDAVTPPRCGTNPISGGYTICVKPEAAEAYRNDAQWSKYRIITDAHETDGLIYVADGDNKAELAGYIKMPENTFDIPQTVNIGGKTRTVTAIGPNALAAAAFTTVNVPKTVESIGQNCFADCNNLTSAHIAEAKVRQPYLNMCFSLQNISADESNAWHTVINGVLYNKAADTLQAYPVAAACETFVLPESVKAIDDYVWCLGLGKIGLKSFYSMAQTPPACGYLTFYSFCYYNDITLYVPQNSVQEYSTADGWRNFINIVGLTDDEMQDVLTSVSDIKNDGAARPYDGVFYTISGQRVTKPAKGLYISNGKKMVVR